jgi:hypothetical protein
MLLEPELYHIAALALAPFNLGSTCRYFIKFSFVFKVTVFKALADQFSALYVSSVENTAQS